MVIGRDQSSTFQPGGRLIKAVRVLPVQRPYATCFEKPKLKMSEFGVKKDLLIKKAPAEKIGTLVVSQIHLKKVQSSGFFYVKGRGK